MYRESRKTLNSPQTEVFPQTVDVAIVKHVSNITGVSSSLKRLMVPQRQSENTGVAVKVLCWSLEWLHY